MAFGSGCNSTTTMGTTSLIHGSSPTSPPITDSPRSPNAETSYVPMLKHVSASPTRYASFSTRTRLETPLAGCFNGYTRVMF
jgi:hypothetical protein